MNPNNGEVHCFPFWISCQERMSSASDTRGPLLCLQPEAPARLHEQPAPLFLLLAAHQVPRSLKPCPWNLALDAAQLQMAPYAVWIRCMFMAQGGSILQGFLSHTANSVNLRQAPCSRIYM